MRRDCARTCRIAAAARDAVANAGRRVIPSRPPPACLRGIRSFSKQACLFCPEVAGARIVRLLQDRTHLELPGLAKTL